MYRDYEYLKKSKVNMSKNHISYIIFHYLYVRSFYKDLTIKSQYKRAFEYWVSQAEKYWSTRGPYAMAMAAVSLNRY
jgi:transcription initiation factor TFIIIB Brf1 subunit/transcription initiation factor TFIIB